MRDVLIVVDMQEAAVANGRQFDLGGVIERINTLAAAVRAQHGTVIFVQHDGAPDDAWAPMSAGWQVANRMHRDSRDVCVRKRTNDAFHDTALDACLRQLTPERVLIAG